MNKKLIPYFFGKKIGGKLLLNNKTEFDRYSDTIKDGGIQNECRGSEIHQIARG